MKLKNKIQHALDESRMLILGVQVLLGFELQAFLMSGYDKLPGAARVLKLASLSLLLIATALILAPVARHRIVDEGRDTPHLHAFTRRAMTLALLPFALSLGAEFYIVGSRVWSQALGIGLAASTSVTAVIVWYAVPWRLRRRDGRSEDRMEETKLNDKIRHVLTEARVVLPGTQALLGFQFVAVLQPGFDELPVVSKLLHVGALCLLGASVVALMLPAAYHRIAEGGEISERLHRLSSGAILFAMATLALAIAGDAFIVVRKGTDSRVAAAVVAGLWLLVSFSTWFGLMLVLRSKRRKMRSTEPWQPLLPAFERG